MTGENVIPLGEIEPVNLSAVDEAGMVFRWRDGFYRGLRPEAAPFYRELFQTGIVQRLVERGLLVDSQLTPLSLEGFDCVIRHRKLPFVTFPHEWAAPMLRAAGHATLDLLDELARDGLTLKDGHLFNSLFDGPQPIHVDLTSIIRAPADGCWPGASEFRSHCIMPLRLMEQGDDRLARILMYEEMDVSSADIHRWHGAGRGEPSIRRLAGGLGRALWQQLRRRLPGRAERNTIAGLRAELGAAPDEGSAHRTNPTATLADHYQEALRELLARLQPRTLVDLGCGRGACSRIAAQAGTIVVSMDQDAARVAELYRVARHERLSLLPLVMDFCRPTPSAGPLSYWSSSATERLQCEMVLALDLLPSLLKDRGMHFREIVAGLAAFSSRWTVAGFPRRSDARPEEVDDLLAHLRREYRSVEQVPLASAHHLLFLCEK